MSIRNKLLIGFTAVLAVALVAFIIIYLSLQQVMNSYQTLAEREVKKLNLAHDIQFEDLTLTDSIRGIIIEPTNQKEIDRYNEFAMKIEEDINEVKPLLDTEETKGIFENLDQHNQTLIDLETQMIELAASDKQKTLELFNGEYAEIREIFSSQLETFKDIQLTSIANQVQVEEALMERQSFVGLSAFVIAIIIGILIAISVSRNTTKPLIEVVHKLEELSNNEGDLTARLEVKSSDEVGQLATAFNKMLDNIQHLIKLVQKTTVEVAASSEELSASAEQNAAASNQLTNAMQEISTVSEKQVRNAEESVNFMTNVSSGASQIANFSLSVFDSAKYTTSAAQSGNEAIFQSREQMKYIQKTVAEANQKTKELGQLTKEIGHISDVITGISDQTNLLALNAAIEAARAGEQGKGFAVVAGEVRKLAEESKKSASQITAIIQEIQTSTEMVIDYMVSGQKEVDTGLMTVNEASDAFEKISKAIEGVTKQVEDISSLATDMSTGVKGSVLSIDELSEMTKQASATIQNVAASSEEQLASIEEITSSAENLASMAEKLQTTVGKFKV